jgi:hypothetical protein
LELLLLELLLELLLSFLFLFVDILPDPEEVVPPMLLPTPPVTPLVIEERSKLNKLVTFPIIFETWFVEVVVVVVVRTPWQGEVFWYLV